MESVQDGRFPHHPSRKGGFKWHGATSCHAPFPLPPHPFFTITLSLTLFSPSASFQLRKEREMEDLGCSSGLMILCPCNCPDVTGKTRKRGSEVGSQASGIKMGMWMPRSSAAFCCHCNRSAFSPLSGNTLD